MERAIITEICIDQKEQIRHFQFSLPLDAKRIIGLEHSVWMEQDYASLAPPSNDPFVHNYNPQMGVIKLQGCDNTNIFYSCSVRLDEYGLNFGNFANQWLPKCFTHQGKRTEEPISIPLNTPVVYGLFKDQFNLDMENTFNVSFYYKIKIVLWYELEQTKS